MNSPFPLADEDKTLLDRATSFDDLLRIAISMLERTPKPIVVVCGPITTGGLGSEKRNVWFFNEAISLLQQKGLTVFDQMVFHAPIWRIIKTLPPAEYHTDILDVFCDGIFRSGHLSKAYFLPGWESSKGARWERERLTSIGIDIEDFDPSWTNRILSNENP